MGGFLVAIDGPAGSGKSSVARGIAQELGISHLDTGATYRALALRALQTGTDPDDATALARLAEEVSLSPSGVILDGRPVPDAELRTPQVSAAASRVSAHPEVRRVLVERQRHSALEAGSAVMEGRDIGTVVLPDARLKVFLNADPEERALRRARQSGREGELERIREAIRTRDRRDSERETSPLRPAPDAVVLDTTSMTLKAVVEVVLQRAHSLRKGC
jgi:cytidylate kinase